MIINYFFIKKNVFVPKKWFVLATILFLFSLLSIFITIIHPFLACTIPIKAEAAIIEGWLPDYCLEQAVYLLAEKKVKKVFTTGIPLENGSYLKEYKTYADLATATLTKLHVPDSLIITVPAAYSSIDRTYASACALRTWLDSSSCTLRSLCIISQSTHTRRSLLLFKRALGTKYHLGSIAVQHRDYHPKYWWKSSHGVRSVLDESIAYIYALFFITFTNTTATNESIPNE